MIKFTTVSKLNTHNIHYRTTWTRFKGLTSRGNHKKAKTFIPKSAVWISIQSMYLEVVGKYSLWSDLAQKNPVLWYFDPVGVKSVRLIKIWLKSPPQRSILMRLQYFSTADTSEVTYIFYQRAFRVCNDGSSSEITVFTWIGRWEPAI